MFLRPRGPSAGLVISSVWSVACGAKVGKVFTSGSVGIWKVRNVLTGSLVVGWGGEKRG